MFAPPRKVSWTGFEPSALQTQICAAPERSDTKETFLPSGEYAAIASLRVEALNLSGDFTCPLTVGICMRKMW